VENSGLIYGVRDKTI